MGQTTPLSLTNGLYVSESPAIADMVVSGFYVNIPETQGAISDGQLLPVGGLTELVNTGVNEINRGSHVMAGTPYFINGQRLYRLESDLETVTDLGEISGAGRVSTSDNGTQMLIIVPKTRIGYIYTEEDGLTLLTDATFTDPDKAAPEIGVFIDSYFVINRGSKEFFCSNVNNGLVYDALDFGSAEADPDVIRSLHVHKNQLYVFGSETIEVFQTTTSSGAGFPFQRINGFVIPKGIAAPFSVTEFNSSFTFIGQGVDETPKVYIFTGSGVTPISTTSIDFLLQQNQENIADVFTLAYSYRGAVFVGYATSKSGSIFYDAKASELSGKKQWHLRESTGLQEKNRWRANSLVTAYGKLLVGDSESGIIGEYQNDINTDYGNPIVREFSLQTLENNSNAMYINKIEVVIDSGQGLINGDDPFLFMQYSDDGRVYTSPRSRNAGAVGEYSKKLCWHQLGMTERYRIFKFTCSADVRWVILKVLINADG